MVLSPLSCFLSLALLRLSFIFHGYIQYIHLLFARQSDTFYIVPTFFFAMLMTIPYSHVTRSFGIFFSVFLLHFLYSVVLHKPPPIHLPRVSRTVHTVSLAIYTTIY